MKKVLVLILFRLLMINNSFSQDPFSAASLDLCQCLNVDRSLEENRIIMVDCLSSTFHKHFENLRTETDITDSLELYNLMIRKTQPEIVQNCEAFRIIFNREYDANNKTRSIDLDNCKKYKYGEYQFFMKGDSIISLINRSKKRVKSFDSSDNILSNQKITWLNECDYFSIINSTEEDDLLKEGDTLFMQLMGFQNDTLSYEMKLNGMSLEILMIKAGNTR
ncbi:MAG: hypothetical protein RLN79_12000 [Cytophagales bacterium]